MAQIYGIDLSSEKFDVNFLDAKGTVCHMIVRNEQKSIGRFLDSLPEDVWLVAEHTGVYGDLLLYLSTIRGVRVSYVSGYEVKHSSGLSKGKSDRIDAAMLRDYGERHTDRLEPSEFPTQTMYRLRELYATRRLFVKQRKEIQTMSEGDRKRPVRSHEAQAFKEKMLSELDSTVSGIEEEMQRLIDSDPELKKSSDIARSIPGIGKVTSTELIIKTDNFRRVSTARKCASLAGIAPFPNSTGKSDRGNHVSKMGDRELKSLLFMCAQSASRHFEKMRVYKMKKLDVERKHYFLVMNNIANRLLKILYTLIRTGQFYDPLYLPGDPRLKKGR